MNNIHSIRTKLTAATSIIFLAFIITTSAIWHQNLEAQAERTATQNIQSTINIAEASMDKKLKDIVNIMSLLTSHADSSLNANILSTMSHSDTMTPAQIVEYRRSANDYLISLCSFQNYLNGLRISSFNGESFSYGNVTGDELIKDKGYLELLPTGQTDTAFIEPHYWTKWYANSNDYVFSIMKPVFTEQHTLSGYVISDIDSQIFDDYFGNLKTDSSLFILDSKGQHVIYQNQNRNLPAISKKELLSMSRQHLTRSYGNFISSFDGSKYLIAYTRSPLTRWVAVSIMPEAMIMRDFSSVSSKLLILTLILLMIFLAIIWLNTTAMTRNIVKLTTAVKNVGNEQLNLQTDIHSNDEVGELSRQFQFMMCRINSLLQNVKVKELEKRKAEISALQFQMNPHFLYNSLNTIRFLASLQGIENIEHVAEILSSMMHLNMDGRSEISIKEDADFVRMYLDMQTYRQINLFTYDIRIDPEAEGCFIPKLLVQPLVENAIKHGLCNRETDGHIDITYTIENSDLIVRVKDNGIGIPLKQIERILNHNMHTSAGHIGLANIRERILLNYGENYSLHVESEPGKYTLITLHLPVIRGKSHADNFSS
ncbi:sensor histidine kinase [Lachnospiraceae bacterium YH-ros2226]